MSMDNAPALAALDPGSAMLSPLLAWQTAGVSMALEAQQYQWKMMLGWQEALGAMQREWWDGWIARYGGGVPLDA